MTRDALEQARIWSEEGSRVAVATVLATRRSAPRPPGTKMAVREDGAAYGSVSGGCVEGAVVALAGRVLERGVPELASFGIADDEAWGIGLPCGGEIDVFVAPYEP